MTEIVPPTVIRQIAQPITGGEGSRAPSTAQQIGFYAYGNGKEASFTVLAGEGAVTLTGGWVKLAKVQRFQRVSVTVPEGYDPLVITVPILFDATLGDQKRGSEQIEADIKKLEWMAGREEHPASEITGEPPYVEAYSLIKGIKTNLVPTQFQSVGTRSQEWYISQITYDANPLRVQGGDRIRQMAVVELTEIVLSASALSRVQKQNQSNEKKYKVYTTTSQVDTIRKVAAALTKGRETGKNKANAWKVILKANPKLGNNADKKLKAETKVKYPESVVKLVPR